MLELLLQVRLQSLNMLDSTPETCFLGGGAGPTSHVQLIDRAQASTMASGRKQDLLTFQLLESRADKMLLHNSAFRELP